MDASFTLPDFSIVKGGPFFRAERRLHLVRPTDSRRGWRTLVFVAVAWLPLFFLTLSRGDPAASSLLMDWKVHAQLLISLPVLVAAEPYVDRRISQAARQFFASRLLSEESQPAFEEAARVAMRRRDSALAEACLMVLAFALAFAVAAPEPGRVWIYTGAGSRHPSLAGWWYLALSQPLVRFLELRWIWRAILWFGFLFRIARLPLVLVPTHPDMMGGLGFLPVCQSAFAPVVFALATPLAAHLWISQPRGVVGDPLAFVIPLGVLGAVAALAVFAPLGVFTPHLVRAKRRGDDGFAAIAAWHSRRFEWRWTCVEPPADLMEPEEFALMADQGTAFTTARKMRLFPYDQRAVVGVAAAALAPLVFLLILDRQFLSVVKLLRDQLP